MSNVELRQDIIDSLTQLYISGSCASLTDAANKVISSYFTNDYPIVLNGMNQNITRFMVANPYVRDNFLRLNAVGTYEKKFITNFNNISSDTLKRAIYNFIEASVEFIYRKYGRKAKIGTVENMSIYYFESSSPNDFWHALYIDVKYQSNSKICISRFMQLKLRNRLINNHNLLWDEIQNYLKTIIHGTNDVYILNAQELEQLTEHLNQV